MRVPSVFVGSKILTFSTKSVFLSGQWKTKLVALDDQSTKVAHCTQVHDMWPLGPLFNKWMYYCIAHIIEVCLVESKSGNV